METSAVYDSGDESIWSYVPDNPMDGFDYHHLPDPANDAADAYALREWMRGKGHFVRIDDYDDGFSIDVIQKNDPICHNVIGFCEGTTEHHATTLAAVLLAKRLKKSE